MARLLQKVHLAPIGILERAKIDNKVKNRPACAGSAGHSVAGEYGP